MLRYNELTFDVMYSLYRELEYFCMLFWGNYWSLLN